jgi:class 3 adenylate cyclase
VELPGADHAWWVEPDPIAEEVRRFLDGIWESGEWDALACAISDGVRELGLMVRSGLHTGECELVDGKVGGIAVHIGARVAGEAAPGEVLVSSTVKDLVAGSGIQFRDRGAVELKGIPDEWRLYAVAQSSTVT